MTTGLPPPPLSPVPAIITPAGHARLKAELEHLVKRERPMSSRWWAASNGDRSEKRRLHLRQARLREIDRRIRFLGKRLDNAEVVDPWPAVPPIRSSAPPLPPAMATA